MPDYEYDNYRLEFSCDQNEERRLINQAKAIDKGYNVIYRKMLNKKGVIKHMPLDIYTSCGTNSNIRDAETGAYYKSLVGSSDEDLYFKVILATGECSSKNGSNTLFYSSPSHYMSHFKTHLTDDVVNNWQSKCDARIKEKNSHDKNKSGFVYVN
jgi:hypothetical protein